MDWKSFLLEKCPPSVYYVPEFITTEEEASILQQIDRTPKPRWTQLAHRRLINYGGVPHPKGMIAEEIPTWLKQYVDRINQMGVLEEHIKANHVLVNEYTAGQGIMPHLDGPLFYPTITTISCGSHTILEYYEECETPDDNGSTLKRNSIAKVFLEPRSLLIVKEDMYHKYLHSIAERMEDTIDAELSNGAGLKDTPMGSTVMRGKRISLTIRHVPKTSKMKIKLF